MTGVLEKPPTRLSRLRRGQKYKKYWPFLTGEQALKTYERMKAQQQYRCAICSAHEKHLEKKLVVDHDHDTGQVRGLLCTMCNLGLGIFSDSKENLQAAAVYLARFV